MSPGRPNKIESSEQLWEYFIRYRKETKDTPFKIKDWVGKDAEMVYREKEKPLTLEGFSVWLSINSVCTNIHDYFANTRGRYKRFSDICRTIKEIIRQDQIEGGMAGIYNPSITQRLNNLVEKSETKVIEQPLFNMEDEDED